MCVCVCWRGLDTAAVYHFHYATQGRNPLSQTHMHINTHTHKHTQRIELDPNIGTPYSVTPFCCRADHTLCEWDSHSHTHTLRHSHWGKSAAEPNTETVFCSPPSHTAPICTHVYTHTCTDTHTHTHTFKIQSVPFVTEWSEKSLLLRNSKHIDKVRRILQQSSPCSR